MRAGDRVRRIYERHPYPPPALRGSGWVLPSVEWINTFGENVPVREPRRILVAGCGVGLEAFALGRRFPEAAIVAVDFSPRSIATAKKLQRKTEGGDRVTFEVADLADATPPAATGARFDLISCHGVMSYIPDVSAVARNLARCLRPAGLLVAGVNGASHPSVRWRPMLAEFGFDPIEFRDSDRLRRVLQMFESLLVHPAVKIAERDGGYLAGDLFGPLNRALSLAEWTQIFAAADLHLFGVHHTFFASRALLAGELHSTLLPRSRAQVAQIVDAMQPASFHHIVLSRRRPTQIRWMDNTALMRMRPIRTPLYRAMLPRHGKGMRDARLESEATQTAVTLTVAPWQVNVLADADGVATVRQLLGRSRPSALEVRESLYLLYLFGAINLLR